MPKQAIEKAIVGEHLTREEAERAVGAMMDGTATPAQIGALLVALRMKGETVEEVTAFARAMRARAIPVRAKRTPLLDTCGTGGSRLRVFNVSTCAAFVAAAAGIAVAKHGNRAISGVCGSADVLEALGVRVDLSPEACAACIDEIGIGFLFAPQHHPATRHVGGPRREIGIRTLFNLLGPLSNPAGASFSVMGVYERRLCRLAAGTLHELGSERAIVAHGEIGIGEIATIGQTHLCELRDGELSEYTLSPDALGLDGPEPAIEMLSPANTREENAQIVRNVLSGEGKDEVSLARRDLVAVNAGAALRVRGLAESWPEATEKARAILASGAARDVLEQLARYTQEITEPRFL